MTDIITIRLIVFLRYTATVCFYYLRFYISLRLRYVVAWLSGNALVSINVVALRRARLVPGWVTVRGYTILVFNQSHPDLLSLAIPPWVGTMSTGCCGLDHR